MSQHPAPQTPFTPYTPPVVQGRVPVNTIWPKVIGITSIILGGLGVLLNCWGVVSMLFVSKMMAMVPQPSNSTTQTTDPATGNVTTTTTITANPMLGMQGAISKWQGWLAAGAGFQLLAAAILIFAGVALLRRSRSGVTLHYGYAAVRTLSVLAYSSVNYFYMRDIFANMANQPSAGGAPPAMVSGMMSAFGFIGVIIGVVWGIAYPAFLVIWFNTTSVRRETAEWR